jgi:hypothetical protein
VSGPTFGERVADTEQRLLAWCRAAGHHITADGGVYEEIAALILDRSPGTLQNWRSNGGAGVPWYRSGRVRYRLRDLADYLERQRQDGSSW